jgi:hypothetical protein
MYSIWLGIALKPEFIASARPRPLSGTVRFTVPSARYFDASKFEGDTKTTNAGLPSSTAFEMEFRHCSKYSGLFPRVGTTIPTFEFN